MAQKLEVLTKEEARQVLGYKSIRNVDLKIQEGKLTPVLLGGKVCVAWDDRAERMQKKKSARQEEKVKAQAPKQHGVPERLLFRSPEPEFKERFGKARLMTIWALEEFFKCSGTELTMITRELNEHPKMWAGRRLFCADSAEAYLERQAKLKKAS